MIPLWRVVLSALHRENMVWKSVDVVMKFSISQSLMVESEFQIENQLGSGNFGIVYKGYLNNPERTTVAIKTLKDPCGASVHDIKQFVEEAMIMKDFNHQNVLSLIGICIENDCPRIVLPYMKFGNAKEFIRNRRQILTLQHLLIMAVEVAEGMDYLSQKHFIHRDLATRNCMVDGERHVKVADFGLARDIYSKDYYQLSTRDCPLPVKWMALESLVYQTYTTKSDVWSYGVLVWELLTRGSTPYSHVARGRLVQYIIDANKLEKPQFASQQIYGLMMECWNKTPEQRPSFSQIVNRLSRLLQAEGLPLYENITESNEHQLYLQTNVPAQNA